MKSSKSIDDVMEETSKVRDLVKDEVWMLIDTTTTTPTMAEKDK